MTRSLQRRGRSVIALAAVGCAVFTMTFAATAQAVPNRPDSPALVRVSDADPLPPATAAGHCGSAQGIGGDDRSGWAYEPKLSVDPRNAKNLVTAWIQDWADAITVGYSSDGGRTWARAVPPTTVCTPGGSTTYDAGATDPWLAHGLDGTVYLSSFATQSKDSAPAGLFQSAVLVNTSSDGGRTWSPPGVVETATAPLGIDGSQVVADVRDPHTAYVTWRVVDGLVNDRLVHLSVTHDSGRTWSAPMSIPAAQPVLTHRLLALPDGSLMNVTSEMTPQVGAQLEGCLVPQQVFASTRSTDGGRTWSTPTLIASTYNGALAGIDAVAAPDGSAYLAFQDPYAGPTGPRVRTRFIRSRDGGTSWTDGLAADEPGQPHLASVDPGPDHPCLVMASPNLAVTASGTVGLLLLDHRTDPTSKPGRGTDAWLLTTSDGGFRWHEQHLAGPFDQTSAPSFYGQLAGDGKSGEGDLGDYQGFAPMGDGFAAALALPAPMPGAAYTSSGRFTDVYLTTTCKACRTP